MSDINIKVVTESKELEALALVWDELTQKSDDSSIFLTYEWASTWWRHLGGANRLNILVFEKAGEPVGIIPLMKSRYAIGPFAFNILETIGATNDNRIGLISAESKEEVVAAFLSYIENELMKQPLIIRLRLVPDDSQFLRVLQEKHLLFSTHLFIDYRITTLAPYVLLPQSWEAYFASLSRNRRKILRQATRRLEKVHNVEYSRFSPDSIQTGLETLFALHVKRWQSVNIRSQFSNPKMREFYRELSSRFLAKDWLHFSYLSVDGVIASVLHAFTYNGKFFGSTCARDLRYSENRVGHLHNMYSIRGAIAKQLREYDFLRGDEPYKFNWTDQFRRYVRVTITTNNYCPRLRLRFLNLFLFLAEIIRYKYSLKDLYSFYRQERIQRREKRRIGLPHRLK